MRGLAARPRPWSGEPTWGYLYRKLIGLLEAAGFRVIVPLLVPITADDPERDQCEAAWDVYRRWQKPLLTLWGELCPFTHGDLGRLFQSQVPGARPLQPGGRG